MIVNWQDGVYSAAAPDQDLITLYRYDGAGNQIEMVDPRGFTTRYEYDLQNRLTAVIENYVAAGASTIEQNVRTEYTYDAAGNALTQRDGRAKVTTLSYDLLNRQLTLVDPLGNTWTNAYNAAGNVITYTDALTRSTVTAYDLLDRPVSIDYPGSDPTVTFSYDGVGNRTAMTDSAGATVWNYDLLGRPITITQPFTNAVVYTYDTAGNTLRLQYPDGKVVTSTYDLARRLVQVQDWGGLATRYSYDLNSRLTQVQLPNAITTTQQYDGADRLLTITHTAMSGVVGLYRHAYDPGGNRTAITETLTSPGADTTRMDGIFADGFQTNTTGGWSATSGSGLSVGAAATLAPGSTLGLSVAITNTSARYVEDRTPTGETRYRARFYFDPNSLTMGASDVFTTFVALQGTTNQVVRIELQKPGGAFQVRAGTLLDSGTLTNTAWVPISDDRHYVELDWLRATAAGANNGALTVWVDGAQQGALTGLDNDTRVIDTARLGAAGGLDAGTSGALFFDAFESRRATFIGVGEARPDQVFADGFESGTLSFWSSTSGTGLSATAAATLAPGGTLGLAVAITNTTARFVQDNLPAAEPRYRARIYFDPNTLTMGATDVFTALVGLSGATDNLIVELQKPAADYQIRVGLRNDANAFTRSAWLTVTDAPHWLELDWRAATAAGANNGSLAWSVDGAAQPSLPGVDNDTRRIDAVRLGAVAGLDAGTTGTLFFDGFDSRRAGALGPLAGASSTAISYTYDPLARLTGANLAGGLVFSYTYDAVGNRLSETTPLSSLSYTYDDANRLTSVGGQAYVHDRNGNLLSDGVYTYTYDTVDRLITQTGAGVNASYSYNGLSDRQRQIVNGVTTNFALDLNRALTQVLAESSNTYLYGVGRIGERSATAWSYHLTDSLGSVRQLANSTGAITLARRFEPYGDVLTSAGGGASAYGYTGEWQQNSLVYLRARYYASGVGRFISRDTWAGEVNRPLSLNRWGYVEGNPIVHSDPTGRVRWTNRGAPNWAHQLIEDDMEERKGAQLVHTEYQGVSASGSRFWVDVIYFSTIYEIEGRSGLELGRGSIGEVYEIEPVGHDPRRSGVTQADRYVGYLQRNSVAWQGDVTDVNGSRYHGVRYDWTLVDWVLGTSWPSTAYEIPINPYPRSLVYWYQKAGLILYADTTNPSHIQELVTNPRYRERRYDVVRADDRLFREYGHQMRSTATRCYEGNPRRFWDPTYDDDWGAQAADAVADAAEQLGRAIQYGQQQHAQNCPVDLCPNLPRPIQSP